MSVSCMFCVSRGADHSLRGMLPVLCVCVIVCDLETSTMGWPRFELGCCVTEKEQYLVMITKILAHHYIILSNLVLILPSFVHVSLLAFHSRKPSPLCLVDRVSFSVSLYLVSNLIHLQFFISTILVFFIYLYMFRTDRSIIRRSNAFIAQAASGTNGSPRQTTTEEMVPEAACAIKAFDLLMMDRTVRNM
jgi:hypothetical protein